MRSNPICRLTGIEKPIFQGGMAWISDARLAAAVSNAGGLGIISAGNQNGSYVSGQIDLIRTLTDRPFGVNVMLQSPNAPEVARVIAEKRVPVVTTGAGSPGGFTELWRNSGAAVIPVVASVAMARSARLGGASAVIAEGCESGGHVGKLTTMALVPQVCDAVDIPVLAAGGIADGRGMAAALALGACGVQMGTAFLVARECSVHENYKQAVLSASDISTAVTGQRFGASACRCIKNSFTREYLKREYSPDADPGELSSLGVGALRAAAVDGDVRNGCVLAGQISGLVNAPRTAEEIVDLTFRQCRSILKGTEICP